VQGFDSYEACFHSIIYSLSDEAELIEVLQKLVKLHFIGAEK
jgi:nitric oxide reductase NorQ protein